MQNGWSEEVGSILLSANSGVVLLWCKSFTMLGDPTMVCTLHV